MVNPEDGSKGRLDEFPAWAAENGCFAKGDSFNADAWLVWLDSLPRAGCLFAVAPDVFSDAVATLKRSLPWLAKIRGLGFPAAFVAQNGAESMELPWEEFDVLFLGGTTAWKLSQAALELTRRSPHSVHMGRVNSYRRLWRARLMGCSTADGTFLKFGPDVNRPRLFAWLDDLHRQPDLPL